MLLKKIIRLEEGDAVTELLGIQKWEKPIPAQLRGQIRGSFPSWLRKTDQERIQNLDGKINWDDEYEVTIKLDGCFLYKTYLPTWDGDAVRIGDIVRKGIRFKRVDGSDSFKVISNSFLLSEK